MGSDAARPAGAEPVVHGRGRPAFGPRCGELIGRRLGDDASLDAVSRRRNRVVTLRKRVGRSRELGIE